MPTLLEFLDDIPKAELHCHLLGTGGATPSSASCGRKRHRSAARTSKLQGVLAFDALGAELDVGTLVQPGQQGAITHPEAKRGERELGARYDLQVHVDAFAAVPSSSGPSRALEAQLDAHARVRSALDGCIPVIFAVLSPRTVEQVCCERRLLATPSPP